MLLGSSLFVYLPIEVHASPIYPSISNPNPSNNSAGIDEMTSSVSVTIEDPDGNTFNWTIEVNNGDNNSANGESNGSKSCALTTPLAYSTTYTWWVNVTDGNCSISEWFNFTTESEPANNPPSQSGEIPANASTDISRYPSCNVTCNDLDGNTLTVYFYENTTGSWVLQQTNSNHTANTSAVWNNYTNASSYSTTYYWSVNLTDGTDWCNETYHFTIKSALWLNSNPVNQLWTPTNGSTGVSLIPTLRINVSDTDISNQTVNVTWQFNDSGNWYTFAYDEFNGTNAIDLNHALSNASAYSTTYEWRIQTHDNHTTQGWDNDTYAFTTEAEPANNPPSQSGEIPADSSIGISLYPTCNVTCNDLDGDTLTVYFYENTMGSWVLQQTNSSVSSGSNVVWDSYSNASSYSTKYWWSVNATDGTDWTNETYYFTTESSGMGGESIGWELLDDNKVLYIWNRYNDYYFNTSSGIQLTNHYNEYWSHNVLMLGYYAGGEWNLIYRTDELSGFNKDIDTDNETYINATLWKDLSYQGYDFRLAIRYHLGVNDSDLTVTPYIRNLGIAITHNLAFGWELKDIQIDMTEEYNQIRVNNTRYFLNQTLNEKYRNTSGEFYLEKVDKINPAKYLYLKWNPSLDYLVWVKSRTGQHNAPVTLFIKIGELAPDQEKSTELYWLDAEGDYIESWPTYYENVAPFGITTYGTNIWIVDYDTAEVYVYDMDGEWIFESWDTENMGSPLEITTDGTNIWIIDDNAEVYVYDVEGDWIFESWDTECSDPRGITTDGNYIWIVDYDEAEVHVHDMDGVYIDYWHIWYENFDPFGITTDGNYFWITDNYEDEVYKYEMDGYNGTYTDHWDTAVYGNEEPFGITTDGNYFWITDPSDVAVYKYELVQIVALNESVDNYDLSWTTEGHADWFGQSQVYYYDNDAAESGDITDDQYTLIETTVTGPGTLKFHWKVSSEEYCDGLVFLIDDYWQTAISGEVDWQQEVYDITSGPHELTWAYEKDGSVSTGSDCGWLDFVVFTNPPTQSNQMIWNATTKVEKTLNATDVDLYPTSFNVTINDPNGDKMNITILTNESGSWTTVNQTTGSGLSNGSYNFTNTSWVNDPVTTYYISFNVTDGTDWCNKTYHFNSEFMPGNVETFGYMSTEGIGVISLFQKIHALIPISPPAFNGIADNISVYIISSWTAPEKIQCALYNSDSEFIASTEERSDGGSEGWYTFEFSEPKPNITKNTDYHICVYSGSTVYVRAPDDTDDTKKYEDATYPNWESPIDWDSIRDDESISIYCSYRTNNPIQSNQKIWDAETKIEKNIDDISVTLYPTSFNVTINDPNGDKMNITILTNATGSWTVVDQTSGNGLSDGTYSFTNTSWVNDPVTTYYISFNVTDGTDWTNETYHFTTQTALPTVTTNDSIGVEETNATLRGYLSNNGGLTATCGFRYGISTGVYSENFSKGVIANQTEFSNDNDSLTQGQIYFYQAWASNSKGFANGSEMTFLTKPEPATSITITNITNGFNISWTHAAAGNYNTSVLRYNTTGYPTSPTDGTEIYNGTNNYYRHTDLTGGTYYYRIWESANWTYDSTTLYKFSDGNESDSQTCITTPMVITNASTGVEETNATLRGYLSDNGSLDATCGFRYGTSSGSYTANFSKGVIANQTEFSNDNDSLTPGQIYFYQAWAYNSVGFNSTANEEVFLTRPNNATSITITNITGGFNVSWTHAAVGNYNTSVLRYNTTGYPTSPTDGTEVYNGTNNYYEHTGLVTGTTYYYRVWEFANWTYDSTTLYKFSDGNESDSQTYVITPTVITNASTGVEETNATVHGYLQNDGGESCTVRFEVGTTTSYGRFTNNQTKSIGDEFSENLSYPSYPIEILRPNGPGDSTEHAKGGSIPADTNWESVNEEIANDDDNYTMGGIDDGNSLDYYSLENSSIPDGTSINSVSVTLRVKKDGNAIGDVMLMDPTGTQNLGEVSYPSSWTDVTTGDEGALKSTTRGDGDPWTKEDIDNLQVGYELIWVSGLGFRGYCTQIWVEVNYYSLTPGTLHHCRAVANNSAGTSYGSDQAFLTKPNATTSFNATAHNSTQINLTWVKGDGANNTYIERNTTTSWSRGDGEMIYNDSGVSYEDTGLSYETTYYYQAWSYANWTYNPTLHQYSDDNASASNTTNNVMVLSNENPTNKSTGIALNPTLEIQVNHSYAYQMNITWYWGTDSSCPNLMGSNTSINNGTYYQDNDENFSSNDQKYYWRVTVDDGHGEWINRTYHFTTEREKVIRSIQVNVSAGVNDAHERDSGIGFGNSGVFCEIHSNSNPGNRFNTGLCFKNIEIPQGTIINDAYVKFYIGSDDPHLTISCHDVDNSQDFEDNPDVTTRTGSRTSSTTSWSDTNIGTNSWHNTPDFKGAVQEVIDRTGWSSGNNITVLLEGGTLDDRSFYIRSYEHDPYGTYDAELYVNYTTYTRKFGKTTKGSNDLTTLENQIRGVNYSYNCQYDGKADSITIYVYDMAGTSHIKCALYYANNDTLLAQTEEWNVEYDWDGWRTFSFSSPKPILKPGIRYYICMWSDGYNKYYYDTVESIHIYNDNVPYGANFPDPLIYSYTDKVFSIYCNYHIIPVIYGEYPPDASTNIAPLSVLNVTVDYIPDNTVDAYWYSNSTGVWALFGSNLSVNTDYPTIIRQTNSNFSEYNTTYFWSVNVTDGTYWTNETYHFTTEIVSPTVTTNDSTRVEETNATLHGYLQNDGGESCTVRFEWGNTTSYGTNTSNQTKSTGDEFSESLCEGGYQTEILRPDGPGDSTEHAIGGSSPASTNWESVDEESADDDITYVMGGIDDGFSVDYYSLENSSIPDGTSINSVSVTLRMKVDGMSAGDIMLRDPTGTQEVGDTTFSDMPWTNVTEGWQGNPLKSDTRGDGDPWTKEDIDNLQVGYEMYWVSSPPTWRGYCTQIWVEVNYSLTPGTLYHYRAVANNSAGTSYGSDQAFLTKPNNATSITIANVSGGFNISWTHAAAGNYNTSVLRYNTTGYPTSPTDGTEIYNGTNNYYEHTGLVTGTTYYYRVWESANWTYDSTTLYKFSDGNESDSQTYVTTPMVTTNTSTGVEETNATLRGYLSDDGGLTTTCGFRYGTSSGVYSENFSKDTYSSGTEFSNDNDSLTQGQIYFYQAWASNSKGFANGSEMTFLTKPEPATSITITNITNGFNISWTHAAAGNYNTSVLRHRTTGYPTSPTDGTEIYNGTNNYYEHTGLVNDTTYYYRVWESANWTYDSTTLHKFSDGNESDNKTYVITTPTVITNASTGVEETNATLHGYLQNDGGESCTVRFEYGTTTSYGTNTTNQTKSTGDEFSSDITEYSEFYFDGYNAGEAWTLYGNPEDMVDGSTATVVWADTAGPDVQLLNSNTCPDTGSGGVTKVELRAFGRWDTNQLDAYLRPVFDGTVDGNDYACNLQVDYGYGDWVDITADPAAPETWTWSNVQNLDCDVVHLGSFWVGVCKVEIRVTYTYELSPGTLYHYRAVANNLAGTSYGSDQAFLTKPNATTSFNATAHNSTQINLTWVKGDGANNTYIERNTTTSWSRGDGEMIYNDSGVSYEDTGLSWGTIYYYQAWSFTNWTYNPTLHQWSDNYAQNNTTPVDNISPTVLIAYNNSRTYYKDADIVKIYANFTETGSGINESTVNISIDYAGGTDLTETPMNKTDNTHWYYNLDIPTGSSYDGQFTVNITAQDNATNPLYPDPTQNNSKYIDNTAPTVLIAYNNSRTYYKDADSVRIFANFTEAGGSGMNETVNITINTTGSDVSADMTKTNNTCYFYDWDVPSGSDGNVNVSINAQDNATNSVTSWDTSKYIDNAAPTLSDLVYDSNVDIDDESTIIRINASDLSNVSSVYIEENSTGTPTNYSMQLESGNVSVGIYNYTLTYSSLGAIQFRIYANDSVENLGNTSAYMVYVQNITLSISLDESIYDTGENITVSGKAVLKPNETNVTDINVSIWIDDGFNGNTTTNASGDYNYTFNISEPGNHTIKVNLTYLNEVYGENITSFETWAPTNLSYNYTVDYSGTLTMFNITAYYKRTDTNTSINGTFNFTITNGDFYNRSCTGVNESFQSYSVGDSGNLSIGNNTINITVSNESAFYTSKTIEFVKYLEKVNTTGVLYAPDKTITDMEAGEDYSFSLNVTLNNTDNATMSNPVIDVKNMADMKSIENLSSCPSSIAPWGSCTVEFNVTVPEGLSPGDYNIEWNASWTDNNDDSNEVTTWSTVTISGNPQLQIEPDNISSDENLSISHIFTAYVNNTGNVRLYDVKVQFIEESMSSSEISFDSSTGPWNDDQWSSLAPGQPVELQVNISILNFTAGIYTGKINITSNLSSGGPAGPSGDINVTVTVSPNMSATDTIDLERNHNTTSNFSFIINSTGNAKLVNVTINYINETLPSSWLEFNPEQGNITENTCNNVTVNLTIPVAQNPGNYTGKFNITMDNQPTHQINVTLNVLENKSWNVTPVYNQTNSFTLNEGGVIANLTIHNTGNVNRTFAITYTSPISGGWDPIVEDYGIYNPTSVQVEKNNQSTFSVYASASIYPRVDKDVKIEMENNTASPTTITRWMFFNVTDAPPVIESVWFEVNGEQKEYVELNKTITLKSNISDDDALNHSKILFNVTDPSGNTTSYNWTSEENLWPLNGERYRFDCSYNDTLESGFYNVSVYAEDVSGNTNTSSVYSFEVIGSTILSITGSNETASNVMHEQGENVSVTVNITNMGNVTAYDINITTSIENWYSENKTITNLTRDETNITSLTVSVPNATATGNYTLDLNLTWKQPNGSIASENTTCTITVAFNPQFDLLPAELTMEVEHGSYNITTFQINATGNENVTFSVNTTPSDLPDELHVDFSRSNGTAYIGGSLENITMNISVDYGASAGLRNFTVSVSADGSSINKSCIINVNVSEDSSWIINKNNLTINAVSNQNEINREINITHIGTENTSLSFEFNLTGNVSTSGIMTLLNTTAILDGAGTYNISLNYTAKNETKEYNGTLTITETNYGMVETVNITFHSFIFNLTILSISAPDPDQTEAGDEINVSVQLIYGAGNITENTNYSINLDGTDCPITNESIANITKLTFSAPSIPDGRWYDLEVQADYNGTTGIISITAENESALYYKDISAPNIIYHNVTPVVEINHNVTFNLTVTDNVGVDTVLGEITYPNSTIINIIIPHVAGDNYSKTTAFSDYGIYSITYMANDTVNNTNSSVTDSFEIYELKNFSGILETMEGAPVDAAFTIYTLVTHDIVHQFSTNATGFYSAIIKKKIYDMKMEFFNTTVELDNVNFATLESDIIDVDHLSPGELDLDGKVVGVNIAGTLSYSGNITMEYDPDYVDSMGYTIADLKIFKCSEWTCSPPHCSGSWSELSDSSTNVSDNSISASFDSLTNSVVAYAIAEGIPSTEDDDDGDYYYYHSDDDEYYYYSDDDTTYYYNNESTEDERLGVETPSISCELYQGETTETQVRIENLFNITVMVTANITGSVKEFITFKESYLHIDQDEEGVFGLRISIPEDAEAKIYYGNLFLRIENKSVTAQVPITIRVLKLTKALLDIELNALADSVLPGDYARFELNLFNLGELARVDVNITVELIDPKSLEVMSLTGETFAVETSVSKIISLKVPDDIEEKKYTVKATADYINVKNAMTATAITYIDVETPFLEKEILGFEIGFLIFMAGGIAIGAIFILMIYGKRRKTKRKREVYKELVDLNTLPKATDKSAFLGLVAETGARSFMDLDNLVQHVAIAGVTGTGKTVAAQVIAEEALEKGKNVIVFDPTGQWTGFLRKLHDKKMLSCFSEFGMRNKDAKAHPGKIKIVSKSRERLPIKEIMEQEGEITIFMLNKLKPDEMDDFVTSTIHQIFALNLEEKAKLNTLIVYDEVHRLLPKFGGMGKGILSLERGAREFRKWGIGLVLISQVLSDFIGELKANIGTEIQMRTRYEGDLDRIEQKYGADVVKGIVRAKVGTGMFVYSEYNRGRPYFIAFRPLKHQIQRLNDLELGKYEEYDERLEDAKFSMKKLEGSGIDTFDITTEIKLTDRKLAQGAFEVVDLYLETVEGRIKKKWIELGKEPPSRKEEMLKDLIKEEELEKETKIAKEEREKYEATVETELKLTDVKGKLKEIHTLIETVKSQGINVFIEEIGLERIKSNLELAEITGSEEELKTVYGELVKMEKRMENKKSERKGL